MRRLNENLGRYLMFMALALFAVVFTSCSGDDDVNNIINPGEPTGMIMASDQTITDNTIMLDSVTVEQTSYVVAVKTSEEMTTNYITDIVRLEEGVNENVVLTLNEGVDLTGGEAGTEITIKLFADNPNLGREGEFDPQDTEIMNEDGTSSSVSINVFTREPDACFSTFDADGNGTIDEEEFATSFNNESFANADTDGDESLSEDEFNQVNFENADANNDGTIDEDEFNAGVAGMFGGNAEEADFATFDEDGDGALSSEEFATGFSGTDWFGNYDVDDDNTLTDTEWMDGVFADGDANGDSMLDETEFVNSNTLTSMCEETDTSTSFADFDTNADGSLDQEEFSTSFQNNFSESDTDADGSLSEDEFNAANFSNADADDDGFVDEDEFNAGRTGMFGRFAGDDAFGEFDTDGDGVLTNEEFGTGFSGTDWFKSYDMDEDNTINDTEFNEGIFNDFDTNVDGGIDETEFNNFNTYTSMW